MPARRVLFFAATERVRWRLHRGLCVVAWLLWSNASIARTVAIVRGESRTPELVEVVTRLHGELLAVDLEVQLYVRPDEDSPTGRDSAPTWLRQAQAEPAVDAVIEIAGDSAPFSIDVWVVDRRSQRFRASSVRLVAHPGDTPEKLAIRTIELLRSSFLEGDMANEAQPPAPPRAVERPTASPRVEHDAGTFETLGLAGGAATLTGLDGVGPAIMPFARLDLTLQPWLTLHAAAAGFGSRPVVASSTQRARLDQTYALAGARYRFRAGQPLRPFLGVSIGTLGTAVEGLAEAPHSSHDDHQWSLLLEGSVGADIHLFDRFYSSIAAHVQLAQPSIAIHILDTVAATTGRPNLALTLTIGAWL